MEKYKDIKSFFSYYLKDIKFDRTLINKLKNFRLEWSTKDEEYIEFLGSNLVGVHSIRFSSIDDENLLSIFNIQDPKKLQEDLYKVNGIDKKWKVASNLIYQLLIYTAHRFLNNKELSENERHNGVKEACLIMQYRMFSSLYSWYFKYAVDENTALTVYEKLSHKYLIKKLESWQDVFLYRVKMCLDKKSQFYNRILRLTTEDAVRIIIDTQTKLRSMLVSIYKVLVDVVKNKTTISTEDTTYVGGEKNEKQIRERTNETVYISILKNIIYKPNDFLDNNLLYVVSSLFPNVKEKYIQDAIKCITNEKINKPKDMFKIIELVISINMEYLQRMNVSISNRANIPNALVLLRNYWSSSKVKNKDMDTVKKYFKKVLRKCMTVKTSWVISSLIIIIVIYMFLRMLKQN